MVSGFKSAAEALRAPLEQLGFSRRAEGIFTIELTDRVLGWLGLNYASRHLPPGQVSIGPVVGIRHQSVERLIAKLRGQKFHVYQPATVSAQIGYVMPDLGYASWMLGGEYATTAMEDLISAVSVYGVPFMQSLTSLPAILDAVNQGMCNYPEYRLPAVLEVMGLHSAARAEMDHIVTELGEREDSAAQKIRQFAIAFNSYLPSNISHDGG
jgi:hypothetical protein